MNGRNMDSSNKASLIKETFCILMIILNAMLVAMCKDKDKEPPYDEPPYDGHYDVYVAGYEEDATGRFIATVWKNGVPERLTEGKSSRAVSVFVSGDNVYVAGYEENEQRKDVAVLWKNGKATYLTDGTGVTLAYSLYVSGNDVYVAGVEKKHDFYGIGVAWLWHNGEMTIISNEENSAAFSVFATDGDVYVAGISKNVAKLWKNGKEQTLAAENPNSWAMSVYVSGSDVYVAGYEQGAAQLWTVDGVTAIGRNYSESHSVFVSGSNTYVAGLEYNAQDNSVAVLWKNGEAQHLSDGNNFEGCQSVYVSDGNVFVAGYEYVFASNRHFAKYWKNGTIKYLNDGHRAANAASIFAVRSNGSSADWDIEALDVARNADYLSSVEKDVILEMNKARTDPEKYAETYIKPMLASYSGNSEDIKECIEYMSQCAKSGILTCEKGLSLAAKDHTDDLGKTGDISHIGGDNSTPDQRIARYGKNQITWGENIDFGRTTAREIVIALLIDDGIPSRGHRLNIMSSQFCQAGVSVGAHPKYNQLCVIDFACRYVSN